MREVNPFYSKCHINKVESRYLKRRYISTVSVILDHEGRYYEA